jgi:4a-hydroxytetrahydrobiopterin dehydratase
MWKEHDNRLARDFEFKNFIEAFSFMTRIALLAEKMNHHPDMRNIYNKVEIRISTHDQGDKVTEKDLKLAAGIDQLV